jgi:hypothetical protein
MAPGEVTLETFEELLCSISLSGTVESGTATLIGRVYDRQHKERIKK